MVKVRDRARRRFHHGVCVTAMRSSDSSPGIGLAAPSRRRPTPGAGRVSCRPRPVTARPSGCRLASGEAATRRSPRGWRIDRIQPEVVLPQLEEHRASGQHRPQRSARPRPSACRPVSGARRSRVEAVGRVALVGHPSPAERRWCHLRASQAQLPRMRRHAPRADISPATARPGPTRRAPATSTTPSAASISRRWPRPSDWTTSSITADTVIRP